MQGRKASTNQASGSALAQEDGYTHILFNEYELRARCESMVKKTGVMAGVVALKKKSLTYSWSL